MQEKKEVPKKWGRKVLFISCWLLFMGWATCRIYVDAQLEKIERKIVHEQVAFEYSEDWQGLEAVQSDFEKDFLKRIAFISKTTEKEYRLTLDEGYEFKSQYFGLVNYQNSRAYKFAYFYSYFQENKGEKRVFLADKTDVAYLDVLDVTVDDYNMCYKVSISEKDLEKVQQNKSALLNGGIKLRPKNFDKISYSQIEDRHFYTYTQDEKEETGLYTYVSAVQKKDSSTKLSFSYTVSKYYIINWQAPANAVSLTDSYWLTVYQENTQLLENINSRTKTAAALKDNFKINFTTKIEDAVVIKGLNPGEKLVQEDFVGVSVESIKGDTWKEYMIDPSKKAQSAKELFFNLSYMDKLVLLDKYLKENGGSGRAGLREAEKVIVADIEANGEYSVYYQWGAIENIIRTDKNYVSVDFGDGVVNKK